MKSIMFCLFFCSITAQAVPIIDARYRFGNLQRSIPTVDSVTIQDLEQVTELLSDDREKLAVILTVAISKRADNDKGLQVRELLGFISKTFESQQQRLLALHFLAPHIVQPIEIDAQVLSDCFPGEVEREHARQLIRKSGDMTNERLFGLVRDAERILSAVKEAREEFDRIDASLRAAMAEMKSAVESGNLSNLPAIITNIADLNGRLLTLKQRVSSQLNFQ